LSIKLDYYIKYYSGKFSTYKLDRTIVTVGAPRMLAMSTSPASAGASSCASAAVPLLQRRQPVQCSPALQRPPLLLRRQLRAPCSLEEQGLALQLRQELFHSGGWATTPSGFPHRVPLAFVALINGLRWRHLLQARKLSHQQVKSRD
jgi:hypothetical protein